MTGQGSRASLWLSVDKNTQEGWQNGLGVMVAEPPKWMYPAFIVRSVTSTTCNP